MLVAVIVIHVLFNGLTASKQTSDAGSFYMEAAENEQIRLPCNTSLFDSVEWSHRSVNNVVTKIFGNSRTTENYNGRFYVETNVTGSLDLVIRHALISDSGTYVCVDNDGFGTRYLFNVKVSTYKTAVEGRNFSVTCCTSSSTANWFFSPDGFKPKPVQNGFSNPGKVIVSAIRGGFRLTVAKATLHDSGYYICTNDNIGSPDYKGVFVIVSRVAVSGSNVTLPCSTNSSKTDWKYWSQHKQEYIYTRGELQNGYKTGGRHYHGRSNSSVICLNVTDVRKEDEGVYICEDDDRDVRYYMGLTVKTGEGEIFDVHSLVSEDSSKKDFTMEPSHSVDNQQTGLLVAVCILATVGLLVLGILVGTIIIIVVRFKRRRADDEKSQRHDSCRLLRQQADNKTSQGSKSNTLPAVLITQILTHAALSPQWAITAEGNGTLARRSRNKVPIHAFRTLSEVCKEWMITMTEKRMQRRLRHLLQETVHWKMSYLLSTYNGKPIVSKLEDLIELESDFLDKLVSLDVIELGDSFKLRQDRAGLAECFKNCARESESKCKKIVEALEQSGQQHVVNYIFCLGETGSDDLPLDKITRDMLRRHHSDLVHSIDGEILNKLAERGVITEHEKKVIEKETVGDDQNRQLLFILSRKSLAQFKLFRNCLAEMQPALLKLLET